MRKRALDNAQEIIANEVTYLFTHSGILEKHKTGRHNRYTKDL